MMPLNGIPVWKEYGYRSDLGPGPGGKEDLKLLIVGGGPVGLAMALDLGRRGHRVVVLNTLPFIARGSKAICFSKRSLEIFDRLGIGDRLLEKGVVWEKGKVFWKDDPDPIYEFDLLPVKDQKFPAFVNIQQYYVEEYLLDEIAKHASIEVRWRHELTSLEPRTDGVSVDVETPDGSYHIDTDYLIACDGNKSPTRTKMGLDFQGRVFEDNFLIADVKFNQPWPSERWFRFDPPYPGWSSLVHKQPDDVWRLDFQLGWDIDKEEAIKPENVRPFVSGLLGEDVDYEFEWLSIYTFQCRRMENFVHGRVVFAGDAAHLVSPFGARGCNGGLQDIDQLGWKLDAIINGAASQDLLASYNQEAITTADENILNSTRSTDFMTPKSTTAETFRDAVLTLAKTHSFARPFVNSGRLSMPVSYRNSPISDPSSDEFDTGPEPGAPCIDAPIETPAGPDWLLSHIGDRFTVLHFSNDDIEHARLREAVCVKTAFVQIAKSGAPRAGRVRDNKTLCYQRYGAEGGETYLVRPDGHVCGRWKRGDGAKINAAINRIIAID